MSCFGQAPNINTYSNDICHSSKCGNSYNNRNRICTTESYFSFLHLLFGWIMAVCEATLTCCWRNRPAGFTSQGAEAEVGGNIFNIFIFKMYLRMLMLKIKSTMSQLSTLWRREWGVFACNSNWNGWYRPPDHQLWWWWKWKWNWGVWGVFACSLIGMDDSYHPTTIFLARMIKTKLWYFLLLSPFLYIWDYGDIIKSFQLQISF